MAGRIEKGWLEEAQRCESPNYNERPDPSDISLLVIHNISLPPGQYGGPCVREFFCNQLDCDAHEYFGQLRDMQVSSHLLIERDGLLVQFVPLDERAWHAGMSHFDGRDNCNDFSIGIELEGSDDEPYTDAQYAALVQATRSIMSVYPRITQDRIRGHCDIAPGRKTDPGAAFDWRRYRSALVEPTDGTDERS